MKTIIALAMMASTPQETAERDALWEKAIEQAFTCLSDGMVRLGKDNREPADLLFDIVAEDCKRPLSVLSIKASLNNRSPEAVINTVRLKAIQHLIEVRGRATPSAESATKP